MLLRYLTDMRLLLGDLPSQHSTFIDLSITRSERDYKQRGDSKNGFNARSYRSSGCFRTMITQIKVNGGDYFRTHSMFCYKLKGTMMRKD
jgi:hypothetical protein